MRRLNRQLLRCLIAIALLAIAITGLPTATDAQSVGRAGLVVVHGDGRQAFAIVQFEGDSITAVEALERTGLEVTELSFGALGVAVCAIEGTGCNVTTCRRRVCQGPRPDDPFWKLFIRTDEGKWQPAPLGISSESLGDGAVRALAWTGTEPRFPAYTIEEIAAKAGPVDGNGVALTRYEADGEVLSPGAGGDGGIPMAGLAAVALAAILGIGLVVRRWVVGR